MGNVERLTLFISLRCTHRCAHCLYGCSPDHGEHMSWRVFVKAIRIAKENNIKTLYLFGGEPMLNPFIFAMLEIALASGFFVILATNGAVLSKDKLMKKFIAITKKYRRMISISISTDDFHLKFFNPTRVISRLREDGYDVLELAHNNTSILLTEYNVSKLLKSDSIDTRFRCCDYVDKENNVGILPDGGWTICSPSLLTFGNLWSHSMQQILEFKSTLNFHYSEGCTDCLKDFKKFHNQFYDDNPLL